METVTSNRGESFARLSVNGTGLTFLDSKRYWVYIALSDGVNETVYNKTMDVVITNQNP